MAAAAAAEPPPPPPPSRRRGPLAALALAVVLFLAAGGDCQMVTPLQGQGRPSSATTEVWISMYLDRLLSVDDRNYRHSGIYLVYLAWRDPGAYEAVQNTTAAVAAGARECRTPCTDWARDLTCCDGIYLPSILFRNAYAFSQDRPTGYKIITMPPPNDTVMWMSMIQAEFYQAAQQMNLQHFPFDSWDLGIATEFLDTAEPPHPGVVIHLSGGGTQKYMFGAGDDVSDWRVQSVRLTGKMSNESFMYQLWSSDASNASDPLPLSTADASLALTPLLPGGRPRSQAPVQMVFCKVQITRHWSYHFLNTIVPVALLGWLSFVVFVLPRKELSTRLSVLVTLFLALAAVNFVVTAGQPASSYILPTQQQILATYVLLFVMAIESILVSYFETYRQTWLEARQVKEARARHLARLKAQQAEAAAEAEEAHNNGFGGRGGGPGGQLPTVQQDACLAPAGTERHGAASNGGSGARRLVHAEHLSRSQSTVRALRAALKEDEKYDSWVAGQVDLWCAVALFFGYTLAVILIYALQSGYIDLLKWE